MKNINKKLLSFIENSPSVFHCVNSLEELLLNNGYTKLYENEKWTLENGKNYFVSRNQSSIIAFNYNDNFKSFNIVASHSDSPCFKLKENFEVKFDENYLKLNIEPYGGMILSTWTDKPLSVAGRVQISTDNGIKSVLVNIDKDILIIPNLAIHLGRDINDGFKYNPQTNMQPLFAGGKDGLINLIAKEASCEKEDIIAHDLYLYPRIEGKILGENEEYIVSPRLDNIQNAYVSTMALIKSKCDFDKINISAVFDNEEVGSGTKQGAGSTFMTDVIKRIGINSGKDEEDMTIAVANSFMISADNAHALHPNFAEKYDPQNRNFINKGIVIKFNANQKYTTDSISAGVFKQICKNADVPYQVFHNRSDAMGGSTLGNILSRTVSVNTIDIGIAQFSMHSAVETAGGKDTKYAYDAMLEFYNSQIDYDKETVKVTRGV